MSKPTIISLTYVLAIAVFCAFLVVLGEYTVLNSGGFLGSPNTFLLVIGFFILFFSCTFYTKYIVKNSLLNALIFSFIAIIGGFVISSTLTSALTSVILNNDYLSDKLGVILSSSFSTGMFNLVIVALLWLLSAYHSAKKALVAILTFIIVFNIIIITEISIKPSILDLQSPELKPYTSSLVIVYTLVAWLIATLISHLSIRHTLST